jgi:hypothetical protein
VSGGRGSNKERSGKIARRQRGRRTWTTKRAGRGRRAINRLEDVVHRALNVLVEALQFGKRSPDTFGARVPHLRRGREGHTFTIKAISDR